MAEVSAVGGTVFLVGAGPGDPGLLTLRAAELLAAAGAVVHESGVDGSLLDRVAGAAERHSLGELGEAVGHTPEEVAARLARLVERHARVVRLYPGDPFLFGRGGREAAALASLGVRFEVVPGLPAGIAAPTYAGIPLTYRGTGSSVTLADAGREDVPGGADEGWERPAGAADTLVLSLGAARLADGVGRLVAGGHPPATPAALVERGTHPTQRTVVGTLATLAGQAGDLGIRGNALLVVGDVVRHRERLAWFEARPLFGMRVVITRARAQADEFVRSLEGLGAEVIPFPTIRVTDPTDPEPLRRAVREVERFDWAVFTSVNGVERFWEALRAAGRDTRALGGVSICAIGPATAAALEAEGAGADLVPPEYVAESVVEALAARGALEGKRILLSRAEVARSVLPVSLAGRGAELVEVAAYRTVPDGEGADRLRGLLERGEVDLLTFTASSTVRNFVDLVGGDVGRAGIACIGPITAGTARELGLPVHIEAESYTIPGLIDAIVKHVTARGTA